MARHAEPGNGDPEVRGVDAPEDPSHSPTVADVLAALGPKEIQWTMLYEGTGTEDQRHEALLDVGVAMYSVGYRRGLVRGAQMLRETLVQRGVDVDGGRSAPTLSRTPTRH